MNLVTHCLPRLSERQLDQANDWVDEDEFLANRAGTELLLPSAEFYRFARASSRGSDELGLTRHPGETKLGVMILALAEAFRAPIRMTAKRLVETGLWRDLVLEWRTIDNDLALSSWWPEQHEASQLLRRNMKASILFGPGNTVRQALLNGREIERLENVPVARGLFWFVRSAPFREHGSFVLSFVLTSTVRDRF